MKKWVRVTPLANSAVPVAAPKTCDDSRKKGEKKVTTGQTKLDRGREKSILYGTTNPISSGENSAEKSEMKKETLHSEINEPVATADQDFKFWQSETLDLKTGRTADSRILYNIGGEDRGVCRDALVGRPCRREGQCPFSHPIRANTIRGLGKDLCLGMLTLSMRNPLNLGDCAVVKVLDVTSPLSFSVFVLDYCDSLDCLESFLTGKKPVEPPGFWELINKMRDFYEPLPNQSTGINKPFRSLEDVTDVFVAVEWNFLEKPRWLRGIVIDNTEAANGDRCLKINLPDIGKLVNVRDSKLIRRLDNRFLSEPWFTTRTGLARISLPVTSSSSPSTLFWFRKLISNKIAWIKVVDEEFDLPFVDFHFQLEEKKLCNLSDFLIEEMVAIPKNVNVFHEEEKKEKLEEEFSGEDENDEEEDEDDRPPKIIPG